MAARCAPLWLFVLGLPLVRSGETEIDFDYLMKQEARTLIMAFYLILFLYPVARWLVNRYTAKIASASQAYLDSLSAKARARVRRARRAPRAGRPRPRAAFGGERRHRHGGRQGVAVGRQPSLRLARRSRGRELRVAARAIAPPPVFRRNRSPVIFCSKTFGRCYFGRADGGVGRSFVRRRSR